jgi:anti-anti-sigma factor
VRLTARLLDDVLADTEQPDDVAVIAARLLPAPLAGHLPADPAQLVGARRAVMGWAAATGLTGEVAEDLQLALGEALANAVEHAYTGGGSGECRYRVARTVDGSVHVEVSDAGTWRPPPADRGFRGRGLELITALAEDVEVTHGPDGQLGLGTRVRFRFPAGVRPDDAPIDAAVAPGGYGDGATARLVAEDGAELRLVVQGELDLASAGPIGEQVLRRLAERTPGEPVVLDLGETTYLASAGVGLVLRARAAAEARGVPFAVRTTDGSAADRILTLSGLGTFLRSGRDPGEPPEAVMTDRAPR